MYRLIYKSRCKGTITWDLINSILDASQEFNAKNGISGVLLATSSHFLQVLEGPFEALNRTFMRIVRDPRHAEVQLVSFNCTENRVFGDWSMHSIGVFDFNVDMTEQLKRKFGDDEGEVRFPIEEWQVLSMISDIRMEHT